jgi:hypothetical protein
MKTAFPDEPGLSVGPVSVLEIKAWTADSLVETHQPHLPIENPDALLAATVERAIRLNTELIVRDCVKRSLELNCASYGSQVVERRGTNDAGFNPPS